MAGPPSQHRSHVRYTEPFQNFKLRPLKCVSSCPSILKSFRFTPHLIEVDLKMVAMTIIIIIIIIIISQTVIFYDHFDHF